MQASRTEAGARIVFQWPDPIRQNAVIGGKILVITFGEPFAGDPEALSAELPNVIQRIDMSRDRRVVTVVLTDAFQLDRRIEGGSMVLTLTRPGASPPALSAVPTVETRFGRHDDFDRLVFAWPGTVGYEVRQGAGRARVVFERAGRLDVDALRRSLAGTGIGVETEATGGQLAVRLSFAEDRNASHFRDGSAVVVDVARATPAPQEEEAAAEQAQEPVEVPAAEPEEEPAKPAPEEKTEEASPEEPPAPTTVAPEAGSKPLPTEGEQAEEPVETPAEEPAPEQAVEGTTPEEPPTPAAAAPEAGPKPTPTEGGQAEEPDETPAATPAPEQAAEDTTPEEPPAPTAAAPEAGPKPMPGKSEPAKERVAGEQQQYGPQLVVDLRRSDGRAVLSLDFGNQVPAAVFRRAGAVWAVFGAVRTLGLPGADEFGADVYDVAQLPHKRATVLRIASAPTVVPKVGREGSTWTLILGEGTLAPRRAAAVESEPHAIDGGRLTVKGPGGAPVRVRDLQAGDEIIVVPLDAAGLGVEPGRRYAQLRLLPTVQGVAIEPLADGVTVVSDAGGVRITTESGLRLSPRARVTPTPSSFAGARLFEFSEWLGGRPDAFPEAFERVERHLMHKVAVASEADRNNRRLDLARFYFAHGLGADAYGVLSKAIDDDEDLLQRAEIRALRGATRFLTRDFEGAVEDLSHPGLDAEAEIALWRGALAASQRNWRSAVANFAQAEGLLRFYPRTLKLEFALLAAEAEFKDGDTDRGRMFLAMIEEEAPTGRTRQEAVYLRGVALEQSGQYEAALEQWRELADRGAGPSRVKAAVSSVSLKRSRGRLEDIKGTIEQLERLRFAWRGDDLEFAVLHQLGSLYLADSQYRRGFETLERAARLYPTAASESGIEAEMRRAFVELFLHDAAAALSPIKALALFDDYKTLMPADARGDAMIAHLVDRLVAVDLLGRASNLLTRQIEARLTGIERAQVGARLALVLLLDDQPRRAINALAATEAEGMPPELAAQRNRLAARGFAEMNRRERALQLLAGDTTDEAEYIRLDLYWRDQEWGKAAEVLSQLADRIDVPAEGALGEEDSRTVLRLAVALALAGDGSGLRYLRARFDGPMAQGPYRDAYAILTSEMERDGIISYETVEATIREVDQYQAFMATYRDRLQTGGLSTIN